MLTTRAATLLLGLLVISQPVSTQSREPLLATDGTRYELKDGGIVELRGSKGRLLERKFYLNFQIDLEYRPEAKSDPGLLVRGVTDTSLSNVRGYRVNLPIDEKPRKLLTASGLKIEQIESGTIDYRPSSEWQQLRVTGHGRRISIVLNGTLAGVFDIETWAGYIGFENSKGSVQMRRMSVTALDEPEVATGTRAAGNSGISSPTLVRDVKPSYPFHPRERGIEGIVRLEAVVLPDGTVGAVWINKPLDPDLDVAAVAALKGWLFKPGTLEGKPIPLIVAVEMTFTLR